MGNRDSCAGLPEMFGATRKVVLRTLRAHRGIIWPTALTDTAVLAKLADTPQWAFKLKREESGFSLLITAKLKLAGCIDPTDYNGHSLSNLS